MHYVKNSFPTKYITQSGVQNYNPTLEEVLLAGYTEISDPPTIVAGQKVSWNNGWVVEESLDLAGLKNQKYAELSLRRKAAEETFAFRGAPLRLDEGTQARINGALVGIERMPAGTTTPWQISASIFIELNRFDLEELGVLAWTHVRDCFTNANIKSTLIEQASSADSIRGIDLSTGWP